jgi:hypothetical protein
MADDKIDRKVEYCRYRVHYKQAESILDIGITDDACVTLQQIEQNGIEQQRYTKYG